MCLSPAVLRALTAPISLLLLQTAAENLAAAPSISGISPAPGFVQELTAISVIFSEPVAGVRAGDFLVNGVSATSVTGAAQSYVFSFSQPPYGPVDITWGTLHTITDLGSPAQSFDGGAPGSTWAYQLIDPTAPRLASVIPMPGATLRKLGQVEATFNRSVIGVTAASLRVNGISATNVTGFGAGPYRFEFPEAAAGQVNIAWNPNAEIVTDDGIQLVFTGEPWTYQIDPAQPTPEIVINELLAENQTGLLDADKDPEDWIELYNAGLTAVNLGGWSFSVDREDEGQWVFPPVTVAPGGYLLVWASGKDRRDPTTQRLHTNFKLNPSGDTLRLFGPELPRALVHELDYPEQAPNFSYGRQSAGVWKFYIQPTPEAPNGVSTITGKVDEVHFSVERGFFNDPFALSLACRTAGAEIRYTLDGSPPTPTNGVVYMAPINVSTSRVVRAAAFAPNQLPSRVRTHTYLMKLASNRRLLPVLSLVTDTNNLYGRTGIMEYNPRNTTKHGAQWERPVSAEWIRPDDNGGFQIDAGLRVAGGDYIRGRYNYRLSTPPEGKYSFRLYFRGDYGPGRLEYPIFPDSTLKSYNTLHLRAGMNDPTNPFLKDEFVRELTLDVGLTACHGTFVYLFLNGVYKGLYNPTERVDDDFLQAYHGGGELWDVIGPANGVIRGDGAAWSQLRTAARKDLTIASNYVDVASRMDLPNFVDYLLPLLWADNDDWPHNNTRAAREKKPGAPFRFYPWDAEFSFGSHAVSYDTIANTLSSLNPPWGTTDYQAMFNSLKKSYEFRLLFADRVHRAFFNDGPLTDARIRARYNTVKAQVAPSISGFRDTVGTWISGRRPYATNMFAKAGFLASSNAPVASQFGGVVPSGYALTLANLNGAIFYTTNGADPRLPFVNTRSASALEYRAPIPIRGPMRLMARSLQGTNWSAVIDLTFQVSDLGSPLRITEIMYNPTGGDAYEFLELQNTGALPLDLSGCSFDGIKFRFPVPFPELAPGARLVLASDARPTDFQRRYPGVTVAGWFGGSLDNGGERITIIDPAGNTLAAVEYGDDAPWPEAADGDGASLEISEVLGNSDDAGNWHASAVGGSPGAPNTPAPVPVVRLNELYAGADRDWIELYNSGTAPVSLTGWSLTDDENPRRFVFAAGINIPGGGYLKVNCDLGATGPLTAPFQLDRYGETISLYDPNTNRVDAFQYGPVLDDTTIGWIGGRWTLCEPTPEAENTAVPLGEAANVRINELLANPNGGDDWIELHNLGTRPVALQGWGVRQSNTVARIEAPAFIAPGGFALFRADNKAGTDHLLLRIPAAGGTLGLRAPDGAEVDQVTYAAQPDGVSTGRLPDGIGAFQQLPFSPTPRASNYLADLGTRLRITEVMARATPGPDWLEIENVSGAAVALTGYSVSFNPPAEPAYQLPIRAGTSLNPGERMLVYCGTTPANFVLPPKAQITPAPLPDDSCVISLQDNLAHIIDRIEYGPQLVNQSVGRANQGWVLLAAPSPGAPNGVAATMDSGDTLRLNEWLAGGGGTNDFVEVYNPAAGPVDLGGWILTDDPTISGSTNRRLAPLTFIASRGFLRFHTDGRAADGLDHTPFQLDILGETIRLLNPSARIVDSVDMLVQVDQVSEGRFPDGAASIAPLLEPTPGAPNIYRVPDADGDGMDDTWEIQHGLDPASAADAQADPDNDGVSNLQEFLSGTDPQDRASLLRLEVTSITAAGVKLGFVTQPGRAYLLQYSDDVAAHAWNTLADLPAAAAPSEIVVTDPAPTTGRSTRFYRIMTAQ